MWRGRCQTLTSQLALHALAFYAGDNNWPVIKTLVDGIILVSDDEIVAAMRHIWERMKLVSGHLFMIVSARLPLVLTVWLILRPGCGAERCGGDGGRALPQAAG